MLEELQGLVELEKGKTIEAYLKVDQIVRKDNDVMVAFNARLNQTNCSEFRGALNISDFKNLKIALSAYKYFRKKVTTGKIIDILENCRPAWTLERLTLVDERKQAGSS